jgi:glycosyltransferase involved in cell wall biosynthesis
MRFVCVPEPPRLLVGLLVRVKRLMRALHLAEAPTEPPSSAPAGGAAAASHADTRVLRGLAFAVLQAIDEKKKWALVAGRQAALECRRNGASAILVSSPPMSALIGALWAGRRAHTPVVIDFRDPCYNGPPLETLKGSAWLRGWWLVRLEPWAMKRAAAIVCTSPSLASMLKDRYPERATDIHCIPNGFDGEPLAPTFRAGLLNIVFAGAIYFNRDPFPFLEAVDELLRGPDVDPARIRILFVGECDSFRGTSIREWLAGRPAESVTELRPPVGQAELQQIYSEATVLLNLAQKQPMQIPAKTFEQLASGKELLLLCEEDSDTGRLVRGVRGVHRVDGADVPAITDVLRDLYRRHVIEGRYEPPLPADIAPFSRQAQNEKLAALLADCGARQRLLRRKPAAS